MRKLPEFVADLRQQAEREPLDTHLKVFETNPVRGVFGAWSICLSRVSYPSSLIIFGQRVGPGTRWHMSIRLRNPRSSTEKDWELLGGILAAFDVPEDVVHKQDDAVRKSPTATYHFYW